jgi:hypothetical protein
MADSAPTTPVRSHVEEASSGVTVLIAGPALLRVYPVSIRSPHQNRENLLW